MNNSNKKKYDLLGVPFGTANNKLRKLILFDLIKKLGYDVCFQCGKKIEYAEELSIEHKIPWQSSDRPIEMFFSLENIGFSHLHCNIKAQASQVGIPKKQFMVTDNSEKICKVCNRTSKEVKFHTGEYMCNQCVWEARMNRSHKKKT